MSEKTRPVAYKDMDFLEGHDGRAVRILSEYLEPLARFEAQGVSDTVVMFGSARMIDMEEAEANLLVVEKSGGDITKAKRDIGNARYYEAARKLSHRITAWGNALDCEGNRFVVCSGGGPGIMEAANRGAAEAGGANIGLNIQLPFEQKENPHITPELAFQFHYFFMRKFWFVSMAKAIIVFPGGFGTMDELFDVMTLNQTGKLAQKISIVLFGTDYWDSVLNFEAMIDAGTISAEDLKLFHRTDDVDDAFEYITRDLNDNAMDCPGIVL
jgi:uncharacterized protein (TIGR00730 family)